MKKILFFVLLLAAGSLSTEAKTPCNNIVPAEIQGAWYMQWIQVKSKHIENDLKKSPVLFMIMKERTGTLISPDGRRRVPVYVDRVSYQFQRSQNQKYMILHIRRANRIYCIAPLSGPRYFLQVIDTRYNREVYRCIMHVKRRHRTAVVGI